MPLLLLGGWRHYFFQLFICVSFHPIVHLSISLSCHLSLHLSFVQSICTNVVNELTLGFMRGIHWTVVSGSINCDMKMNWLNFWLYRSQVKVTSSPNMGKNQFWSHNSILMYQVGTFANQIDYLGQCFWPKVLSYTNKSSQRLCF